MNIPKFQNVNPRNIAIIWIILVSFSVILFFLLTKMSYFKIDAVSIWFFSCIIIFYQSRKPIIFLSAQSRKTVIILGIFVCIFSFINIPIGFGNPPYSIGDFSILLAGIGLILFGLLGIESYLLAVIFPLIAVLGFQFYELFLVHEQLLSAPLLAPTLYFSMVLISFIGIPAETSQNLIHFISKTGDPIYLLITPECTGIWSLGTFTIITLLVLFSFPKAFSKGGLFLIFIGYVGTYAGNILRIGAIAYSGYLFGPTGAIEKTHLHFGWIFFLSWMILFWYIFFNKFLHLSFKN